MISLKKIRALRILSKIGGDAAPDPQRIILLKTVAAFARHMLGEVSLGIAVISTDPECSADSGPSRWGGSRIGFFEIEKQIPPQIQRKLTEGLIRLGVQTPKSFVVSDIVHEANLLEVELSNHERLAALSIFAELGLNLENRSWNRRMTEQNSA